MPIARRPTPPPQAIKQTLSVMDSLNAWTADEDDEAVDKKSIKVPLGYTPLAQSDKSAPPEGWRQFFDSESDNFNFGIGIVIIANAIVIGLETDWGRGHFTICEHIFNGIFVLEMLTRISQIGTDYFTTPAYLFDCSLVVTGSLDLLDPSSLWWERQGSQCRLPVLRDATASDSSPSSCSACDPSLPNVRPTVAHGEGAWQSFSGGSAP